MLEAVDNAHPTYLASKEWMSIPWQTHAKGRFDKLVDIFVTAPEMISKGNELQHLPVNQLLPTALAIVKDAANRKGELQAFYAEIEAAHQGVPMYWPQKLRPQTRACETQEYDNDADLIFLPTLWFTDLETAAILTMYCTLHAMGSGFPWSPLTSCQGRFL